MHIVSSIEFTKCHLMGHYVKTTWRVLLQYRESPKKKKIMNMPYDQIYNGASSSVLWYQALLWPGTMQRKPSV